MHALPFDYLTIALEECTVCRGICSQRLCTHCSPMKLGIMSEARGNHGPDQLLSFIN